MIYPLGFLVFILSFLGSARAEITVVAMAPLQISDFREPNSSPAAWKEFERQLEVAKDMGVDGIAMDVWWGAVETSFGVYNWAYYDKAFQMVLDKGLKLVPTLSFHQLGGNVGDSGFQPIPIYIWTSSLGHPQILNAQSMMERSELGNFNGETVSPILTPLLIQHFRRFMRKFGEHYSDLADSFLEINISLGRSGEFRKPSYNPHDPHENWWDRGKLQIYSPLWINSFRQAMLDKYGSLSGINEAWSLALKSLDEIRPPDDPSGFFARKDHFSPYGMDLFDHQNQVLIDHAKLMFEAAYQVFDQQGSAFSGIDLGAKLPGIHWRLGSDRLAELPAGLIRTSYGENNWMSAEAGYGYRHTLQAFQEISKMANESQFVLHFTALEMDDMPDGHITGSKAKTLVYWMSEAARSLGLTIKGENALGFELENEQAWRNIRAAIEHRGYRGFTALRLDEIASSENKRRGLKELIQWIDSNECRLSL